MALDPITGAEEAVGKIADVVSKFFPDKTEIEKAQIAGALQVQLANIQNAAAQLAAQTNIDQAEAASVDKINHWRGALGWVSTAGVAVAFVLIPVVKIAIAIIHGDPIPDMDTQTLLEILGGMLGITGLHITDRKLNGAASK
jgi:holin (3TMs family)